ncbi:MAG: 30S ribosome-binding factor RbfA [Alphaproteobacteria bacterium]
MSSLTGNHAAEPSQRQLRVGELVRHALADVLTRRDIDDPVLSQTIVSISEVRVSADMHHAMVFAAPLAAGPAVAGKREKGVRGKPPVDPEQAIIDLLNRHARYLRGQISPALRQMRSLPDLQFRLDTRFDDDSRIDALLRSPEVARDIAAGDDTVATDDEDRV